jgi:hypothetical protein
LNDKILPRRVEAVTESYPHVQRSAVVTIHESGSHAATTKRLERSPRKGRPESLTSRGSYALSMLVVRDRRFA